MGILAGKKVLIVGLMSERSIAYGIASQMHAQGATLAFSCLGRFKERVETITQPWGAELVTACDLSVDSEIDALRDEVVKTFGEIDVLVHSVAFAPRDHLSGRLTDHLTREGFRQSMDVSVYSLAALVKAFAPHMSSVSSVLALSYLGAERAIPNYNVMGVAKAGLESMVRYLARDYGVDGMRVNAISAGPVRTASAAGIRGMGEMLQHVAAGSPIPKPVGIDEIGQAAVFLCSDWASAVTGEVLFVDNGYHIAAC